MTATLTNFVSDLIGHAADADSEVRLSSGQKARLASWSAEQDLVLNQDVLKQAKFRLSDLTVTGDINPPADVNRTNTVGQASLLSTSSSASISTSTSAAISSQVGIDIQWIEELIPQADDYKAVEDIAEIFTLREISYAQTRASARETLAGIFSAKEAIRKAAPDYLDRPYHDIEILPDAKGAPTHGGFSLSISHSGGFAVACAIRAVMAQTTDAKQQNNASNPSATIATASVQQQTPASKVPRKQGGKTLAMVTLVIGIGATLGIEWLTGCSLLGC